MPVFTYAGISLHNEHTKVHPCVFSLLDSGDGDVMIYLTDYLPSASSLFCHPSFITSIILPAKAALCKRSYR